MSEPSAIGAEPNPSLTNVVHLVYGLHALSLIIGVTTAATIIGAFLFGVPSLIAVAINYLKKGEAAGTFLESHFRWQIRTFWFALLWCAIGAMLFATFVGIPLALAVFFAAGLWAVYRIVRGVVGAAPSQAHVCKPVITNLMVTFMKRRLPIPISRALRVATFLSALCFVHLLTLTPALSWYDKGHRIVGLIAQAHLSNEARRKVAKILPDGMTLADAAIWPDHEGRSIRDFDPLHYVRIPPEAAGYDHERHCPERNCMVEALPWFANIVTDTRAPLMARRLALYYVAHLVGDMHQPLHAGRPGDRGGIDIQVSYRGATTNLHYFWDTNLVEMEPGSQEEVAKRLSAGLKPEERLQWQAGDAKQWTEESLRLARSHAYNTGPSSELSDDYVEKARPVVRTQLVQAGLRLAWLLNRSLK